MWNLKLLGNYPENPLTSRMVQHPWTGEEGIVYWPVPPGAFSISIPWTRNRLFTATSKGPCHLKCMPYMLAQFALHIGQTFPTLYPKLPCSSPPSWFTTSEPNLPMFRPTWPIYYDILTVIVALTCNVRWCLFLQLHDSFLKKKFVLNFIKKIEWSHLKCPYWDWNFSLILLLAFAMKPTGLVNMFLLFVQRQHFAGPSFRPEGGRFWTGKTRYRSRPVWKIHPRVTKGWEGVWFACLLARWLLWHLPVLSEDRHIQLRGGRLYCWDR